MTLNEYEKIHYDAKKNYFVVSVKEHKTAPYEGPLMLVLRSDLKRMVNVYLRSFRNMLPGIDVSKDGYCFVSWSGRKMDGSMVSNRFNTYWERGLGQVRDKPITTNLMRKKAVTAVHDIAPEDKQGTAKLMAHSLETATKSYYLHDKRKNVPSTATRLRSTLRTESKAAKPYEEVEYRSSDDCRDKDFDEILKHFETNIKDGEINIATVRHKLSEVDSMLDPKKVYDKINYQVKKQQQEEKTRDIEPRLEEERPTDENDFEGSTDSEEKYDLSKVGRRVTFSKNDTRQIQISFAKLIKSNRDITLQYIKEKLSNDDNLKGLEKKYPVRSLLIKVRTERRKY